MSQQVETLVKWQEDVESTDTSPNHLELVPTSIDPMVKVEENGTELKSHFPRLETEEGLKYLEPYTFSLVKLKQLLISLPKWKQRVKCEVCNKSCLKDSFKIHLLSAIHKRTVAVKLMLPNEFDPNNRCSVCVKTFKDVSCFREHLRKIHEINLTPMEPTPNLNITPNFTNSNNHCDLCKWNFSSGATYRTHISNCHTNVELSGRRLSCINPLVVEMDAGDKKNKRCTICKREYACRGGYVTHVNSCHKDGSREPITKKGTGKTKFDASAVPV